MSHEIIARSKSISTLTIACTCGEDLIDISNDLTPSARAAAMRSELAAHLSHVIRRQERALADAQAIAKDLQGSVERRDRVIATMRKEILGLRAQRDAEQNRIDAVARATREAMEWRESVPGASADILASLLDALTGALDIEPRADAAPLSLSDNSIADAILRARRNA